MKIVGLMIARDEELCCGMTVETAKDTIDELVFVDNMSKDNTAEIVRRKCKKFGIILHEYKASLSNTIEDIRLLCLQNGQSRKANWFLNMDADTVFNHKLNLRELIENNDYDQYYFRTLNLYGDMKSKRQAGLNIPHLWLFRNDKNISIVGNYIYPDGKKDPNDQRLLGWNLNGIKWAEHMFWRYMLWHSRSYNKVNKTKLSPTEYIKKTFTDNNLGDGKPTDYYLKTYVLNRMKIQCMKPDLSAAALKLTKEQFIEKYMDYPKVLKEWDCPFELIFNEKDEIVGRKPDLVDVPVLENKDIWHLHPDNLRSGV